MTRPKIAERRPLNHVDPTQFSLLEAEVDGIKNELTEFRAEVRAYFSRSSLRSVWPMVAGVTTVLWFVLNLQISSATKSVDDKATRLQSQLESVTPTILTIPTLALQNATSKQDRDDQRMTLGHLMEAQTKILENIARIDAERNANDREVETQVDAMNQSLSVQFANQQRMDANFQNALHEAGAKYPLAPSGPFYFPNISNRNHRK